MHEITGIVAARQADRAKWSRFAYHPAPYTPRPSTEAPEGTLAREAKRRREIREAMLEALQRHARASREQFRDALNKPGPLVAVILKACDAASGQLEQRPHQGRTSKPDAMRRFLRCGLLRELRPDLSYPAIARATGYADHTSSLFADQRFRKLRDAEPIRTWLAHPSIRALYP